MSKKTIKKGGNTRQKKACSRNNIYPAQEQKIERTNRKKTVQTVRTNTAKTGNKNSTTKTKSIPPKKPKRKEKTM